MSVRQNTQSGPPFFATTFQLGIGVALATAMTPSPTPPAAGAIVFPGAQLGQQVLITPRSALPYGLTVGYKRVIPPVVVAGVITVPGYIEIGFNNTTAAPLPAAAITFDIEVMPNPV